MKQPIRHVLRILLRLLILWAIDAVAMWITITLLPGVSVTGAAVGAQPSQRRHGPAPAKAHGCRISGLHRTS